MSGSLNDLGILDAPPRLHDHGQPRLQTLGQVDYHKFVPGTRRYAGVGS